MERKVGFELELLVLDAGFNESNEADQLISRAKADGLSVVPECSHAMVEVNSQPGSLREATADMVYQLEGLNAVAENLGLHVLPVEMPLNHGFKPLIRSFPRYEAKKRLLGDDRFEISGKVMGFHVHYDLPAGDEARMRQIDFLKLMDPLAIAATASSPHLSANGLFDSWRTHSYRYIVHEMLPFQGQLQGLGDSYAQYVQEHLDQYLRFLEKSREKDVDFSSVADEYNSIWGPVRLNPTYGTSEIRSMGSCPDVSMLVGLSGLVLGGLRRLDDGDLTDSILDGSSGPLEAFRHLQKLSDEAMRFGFKSGSVRRYVASILDFCTPYTIQEEVPLVAHALSELRSSRNAADAIRSSALGYQESYASLHKSYVGSLSQARNLIGGLIAVEWDGDLS